MSIFKNTFESGVQLQLTARQKALVKTSRSSGEIQYFNSRNAWIKMSSAVDVNKSSALAENTILLGGTLLSGGGLRSGVGSGDQAYSTKTPGGKDNKLGIRPMPGIVSLDVKSKSAYGSLREANVSFQCWDIRQLEELEQLYMRPGYSVLVEWGWVPYLDNGGNLQPNISLPDYLFTSTKKEDIWKIIYDRSARDGNYDAVYGFIKNYSWKARNDGGYDCSVSIITMGEILESLKINYGAYDKSSIQTTGLFPGAAPSGSFGSATAGATIFSSIATAFASFAASLGGIGTLSSAAVLSTAAADILISDDVATAYSQNIVAGICAELYKKVSEFPAVKAKTPAAAHVLVDTNNSSYPLNFLKYEVQIASSGPTITNGKDQIYIRLEDFLEILNHYVLLSDKDNGTPLAKLSVRERESKIPLLCLADIHQISTNPHVCLIRNEAYLSTNIATQLGVAGLDVTAVNSYLTEINSLFNYRNPTTGFGEIGNIFVNLDYLYGLSLSDTLAEKDKKEKNDIILFDYIKSMMSGINTAIGNVANFDIFIDPIDSVGRIIDVNYVDTTKRDDAYKNAFEIQVHNLKSTVRNYSLESQIFPEQSTMIAIGAQVKGGALGSDTNTLVDFNKNLVDRIIPRKDAPTAPPNSSVADELAKLKALQESWAIIADLFIQLNPDWFSAGDYDIEESSKYANALKDIISYFTSVGKSNIKNRAILPTKLSLTMDGIGGMIIGNMFKINEDILPAGYKGGTGGVGSKIGYVVTGLGHKVSNNDWTTQVDAQFVILDEPDGQPGFPSVTAINRAVTAAPTGTPPGPPPPGVTGCAMGSNTVNPGVDYSEPAENSGIDFSSFVYPVSANVSSLFIDRTAAGMGIHRGIDLVAPLGTPVYSVCDGEVFALGTATGGYGPNALYIKVDKKYHPGKPGPYLFVYGHLDTNIVGVGAKVKTGQQIGTIGTKGFSTGPHLHFQLKTNTALDKFGTSYIFGKYFPGNTGCSITALDPWGGPPATPPLTPAANALRVKAIAEEIKVATVDAWGTNTANLIAAVKKINDKQTFVDVNTVLGTLVTGLDFKKVLNDELGSNDVPTAKAIRDHLLPFGVDVNYKYSGNDVTSNSFTVTVK